MPRRPIPDDGPNALHDELVALREENARLRAEQYRPVSPSSVPRSIAGMLATAADSSVEANDLSAAWLELELMRQGLIQASIDLQTLAGQLHTQLVELVPVAEIDRRVRPERRSTTRSTNSDAVSA
ncbi:MAG: hypothetical protein U5K29_02215 [Acidimicrobiales bacterium]|nr:hypothetical protein [Acidimicrobiales bacterium]